MNSNRLAILTTFIIVFLFFVPTVLACNYPGPKGSSILVAVYASDGKTPLPCADVTLIVSNGSTPVKSIGPEGTNSNGQFTFPGPNDIVTGLTYKIHATYNGDTISVECNNGPSQSADSASFTLSNDTQTKIYITIPGVTVTHGGETPTACPTKNPTPTPTPAPVYPPMPPGWDLGEVTGVISYGANVTPVSGAYVAIVNATDPSIVYKSVYTGDGGIYQFSDVNSTNDTYEIFAQGYGNETYSAPFTVDSGATVSINLTLDQPVASQAVSLATLLAPATTPSIAPPVNNSTTTPTPSAHPMDNGSNTSDKDHNNGGGLLDQISSFVSSVVSAIFQ